MTTAERTLLRTLIDQARRAQIDGHGGHRLIEKAELAAAWAETGRTKRQQASWLRRSGLSYRQIAAIMGVSHAVVCKWLCPSYAEKQADWFKRNREAHAARVRGWYHANREEILERRRERYRARKAAA